MWIAEPSVLTQLVSKVVSFVTSFSRSPVNASSRGARPLRSTPYLAELYRQEAMAPDQPLREGADSREKGRHKLGVAGYRTLFIANRLGGIYKPQADKYGKINTEE